MEYWSLGDFCNPENVLNNFVRFQCFTLEFQRHGISQVGANVQFQWTSKPLDEPPEVDLVDFYQKSSMPLVWVGQPVGILVLR